MIWSSTQQKVRNDAITFFSNKKLNILMNINELELDDDLIPYAEGFTNKINFKLTNNKINDKSYISSSFFFFFISFQNQISSNFSLNEQKIF